MSLPMPVPGALLIVKRESYRPAEKKRFEDVTRKAEALAFTEQVSRQKKAFFEKQKRDAFIKILKKDPPERWLKAIRAMKSVRAAP